MYTHIPSYITTLDPLADTEQQHKVYTSKVDTSLFTNDTSTQCAFNIIPTNMEAETDKPTEETSENNTSIHFHSKHKYRDTFGDAHIQYHDFDNGDAFTYKDKYTALIQQELHNPVTTKSYQISMEMDIETMPHVMYFLGNTETVTKINHVHTRQYGMIIKACFQQSRWMILLYKFSSIMEQHLPFSQSVLTTNTQYCKDIQRQKVPHPFILEAVQ